LWERARERGRRAELEPQLPLFLTFPHKGNAMKLRIQAHASTPPLRGVACPEPFGKLRTG
jgi:hypothetical protein